MKKLLSCTLIALLFLTSCSKKTTVEEPVPFFKFNFESLELKTGELKPVNLDANTTSYLPSEIHYESLNPSIASIEGSSIKAVSKGNTEIKAVRGTTEVGRFKLIVSDAVATAISVDPAQTALRQNQTYKLTPLVTPILAIDKTIVFSSSNPTVASVSANGVITAHILGNATISATTVTGLKVDFLVSVIP